MTPDEMELADSEAMKRKGFEAGEPVFEWGVGDEITVDNLLNALKGDGGAAPLRIQGTNQEAPIYVHVQYVRKVFEPRELDPEEQAREHQPLETHFDGCWLFEGWMTELHYAVPKVVRIRGYLDVYALLMQRIPDHPDPNGIIERIDT
ncbi:hypothetical protein BTM25_24250 [Actinomadura rubteroloni]|uniref:Uncharacterized protein n=1 Tax=Actinomadura rubteroloni TaxID=1926885 RepID=A0A2P4UFI4_9ACTN|nr:hypothetical protein [Actinomadura rubteroloni]POM23799.1 hypothetical protein BTM25_24250 [Actinomadura rubteroloni]